MRSRASLEVPLRLMVQGEEPAPKGKAKAKAKDFRKEPGQQDCLPRAAQDPPTPKAKGKAKAEAKAEAKAKAPDAGAASAPASVTPGMADVPPAGADSAPKLAQAQYDSLIFSCDQN